MVAMVQASVWFGILILAFSCKLRTEGESDVKGSYARTAKDSNYDEVKILYQDAWSDSGEKTNFCFYFVKTSVLKNEKLDETRQKKLFKEATPVARHAVAEQVYDHYIKNSLWEEVRSLSSVSVSTLARELDSDQKAGTVAIMDRSQAGTYAFERLMKLVKQHQSVKLRQCPESHPSAS
jgi:hypothetical protein